MFDTSDCWEHKGVEFCVTSAFKRTSNCVQGVISCTQRAVSMDWTTRSGCFPVEQGASREKMVHFRKLVMSAEKMKETFVLGDFSFQPGCAPRWRSRAHFMTSLTLFRVPGSLLNSGCGDLAACMKFLLSAVFQSSPHSMCTFRHPFKPCDYGARSLWLRHFRSHTLKKGLSIYVTLEQKEIRRG